MILSSQFLSFFGKFSQQHMVSPPFWFHVVSLKSWGIPDHGPWVSRLKWYNIYIYIYLYRYTDIQIYIYIYTYIYLYYIYIYILYIIYYIYR